MSKIRITQALITANFRKLYHSFSYFWDDNDAVLVQLRNICCNAALDVELLSHIKFCNDVFCIPPVRTFCEFYKENILGITNGKKMTPAIKRGMGAFWGAVFKGCLNYKNSKNKPAPLKCIGLSTASYFYH